MRLLPVLLALVAPPLVVAGCGSGGDATTTGRSSTFQTVREVMYRIEARRLEIEPGLRNPTRVEQMLEAGRSIADLTEDPAFVGYPKDPAFHSDGELFVAYHDELRVAAAAFVASLEAQDLEGWNTAYDAMRQTCTRCHKRFDPNP